MPHRGNVTAAIWHQGSGCDQQVGFPPFPRDHHFAALHTPVISAATVLGELDGDGAGGPRRQ
jgi:hypothetical protein